MSFSEELRNLKNANGWTVSQMLQIINDNSGLKISKKGFEKWLSGERKNPKLSGIADIVLATLNDYAKNIK